MNGSAANDLELQAVARLAELWHLLMDIGLIFGALLVVFLVWRWRRG